jgi:hypothetical protein
MNELNNIYNFGEYKKINENLLKKVGDFFKNVWNKLTNLPIWNKLSDKQKKFFKYDVWAKDKNINWAENAKYLSTKGLLPNGLEIINFDKVKTPIVPTDVEKEIEDIKDNLPNKDVEKVVPEEIGLVENEEEIVSESIESMRKPDDWDVDDLTTKEAIDLLEMFYTQRLNYPNESMHSVFMWGAPGVGKTSILKDLAKKLNLMVIIWKIDQVEPTDFVGLPFIAGEEGNMTTKYAMPAIFPTDNGEQHGYDGGILFFDEFNVAREDVQKSCYTLIDKGEVGIADYQGKKSMY